MTPIEAYSKICLVAKHEPVVMQCRNYEDFYGFYLAPPGSDPKTPTFVGLMCLVFKSSGEVIYEDDRPDIRVHRTPCEGIDPSIFAHVEIKDATKNSVTSV